LKPNQKDQDTLPPYEKLDEILRLYVEDNLSARDIIGRGFDEETVRWVQRRVDLNEYKREQAAPGLKVTSRAFGLGRRMPIAQKYVDWYLGIPTSVPHAQERHLKNLKFFVRGFETSPFGVEWVRFEPDCEIHELIKQVIGGIKVIYPISSPSEGILLWSYTTVRE